MSAGELAPAATAGQLEAILTRLGNLADLLGGLAVATAAHRLQEGALLVAADYAADTHSQLTTLIDAMSDGVTPGAAS